MGGAEQTEALSCRIERGIGGASGQEVTEGSEGMTPVVIGDEREGQRAGWVYRNFTVECDEVYVVAGYKGHPEAVKKKAALPGDAG